MTVEIPICENHAGSPLAIMKVSMFNKDFLLSDFTFVRSERT